MTEAESGERVAEAVPVELPEEWKTFDDGTPQPDWVALLRETRDGPRR
jgi:hypothetical protein